MLKKWMFSLSASIGLAIVSVANAFAAADPTITDAKTQVTTYFTDNLPTIIAAFVAVAMAIWGLSLLFRSVGVKKPSKVG
jgi:hypothetical protein